MPRRPSKYGVVLETRMSRRDLKRELRSLPDIIAGRKRDRLGIGKMWKSFFTQALLEMVHKAYRQKAAGGSDELGLKFKPLSPSSSQRKRKGILRVTDRMYRATKPGKVIGGEYKPPNKDQKLTLKKGELRIAFGPEYFKYHQEGTANIPKRPPIPPKYKLQKFIAKAKVIATKRTIRELAKRGSV